MEDQLDKLLKAHQAELFDEAGLRVGHEKRFAKRLQKQQFRQPFVFRGYHYAAMLLPLFLVVGIYLLKNTNETSPSDSVELAMYSKSLDDKNGVFSSILESKLQEIELYKTADNNAMITQSLGELDKLEKEYETLVLDLEKSGGNPKVVESVIVNLKARIDVLEKLIYNLKLKSQLNQNHHENIL
ncbi:hypothetical protein ACF3NR_05490 [Vaginella massiliensis]|uniref:hypothetical protein n=1 Tax=Vaginella massiliensis TaxID=1816680 RepID=UPI00375221E1